MRHKWTVDLCAFLIVFALIDSGGLVRGQEIGNRTEIVIVGTVHSPTTKFTEETLVTILRRVNPDLIMLELDPSFFDSSFALPEKYQNIAMETKAVAAYGKTASVKMRPFDIEGRNKFYQEHDYFKRELSLNQEIGRMYGGGQLSPEAKLIFEGLRALAAVRDSCGAERPEVINSSACDTAIEKKQDYAFKGIGKIVELTPALKEFKPFWSLADEFWGRRNEAMVRNIIKYSKELQAKRVVVLCGYEHRYYLRNRLIEQAPKEGFVVKEYLDR
jgi:pheromone shutdown protein TraB